MQAHGPTSIDKRESSPFFCRCEIFRWSATKMNVIWTDWTLVGRGYAFPLKLVCDVVVSVGAFDAPLINPSSRIQGFHNFSPIQFSKGAQSMEIVSSGRFCFRMLHYQVSQKPRDSWTPFFLSACVTFYLILPIKPVVVVYIYICPFDCILTTMRIDQEKSNLKHVIMRTSSPHQRLKMFLWNLECLKTHIYIWTHSALPRSGFINILKGSVHPLLASVSGDFWA